MNINKFKHIMVCPKCHTSLKLYEDQLKCTKCGFKFKINNEQIIENISSNIDKKDSWMGKLKEKFKNNKKIFSIVLNIFSPIFPNFSYKKFLLPKGNIILDIGSGVFKLRDDVINIDINNYKEVDLVCDAKNIPFADNSIDQIFNFSLLEHTKDPFAIMDEIYRVLKPGGTVYTLVPFLQPFHSSPDDYWRFTKDGVKELHNNFTEIKIGIYAGPVSSLLWILQDFFSLLFSFGIQPLRVFWLLSFMSLTFPLKILDPIFRLLPTSHTLSSAFYYFGEKPRFPSNHTKS